MAISSFISHIIWLFHFFVTARLIRGLAWLGGKITAVAPPDPSSSSSSSLSLSSSSSSSSNFAQKHDVFLSFRGEDTRAKFTSHLEKRLVDMKVETFVDNRLEKGDKISDALIEAIRGSKMSVIVFSVNYATSSWCLDEVLNIVECMKERGQTVIPVFYEVDPSIVRKQSGTYEAAFAKLEKRFEEKKLSQWRAALTQLANLSGFCSQQYGTDSDFIDAIVEGVLKKLKDAPSSDDHFKDLVGIDQSAEGVKKLLQLDSPGVRIIGIWGMGGLGKTTLARVVSERFSSHFESLCFLDNVREKSGTLGLDDLKKNLFSKLLGGNDRSEVTNSDMERISRKRVLVVLDDVDQPEQLNYLAGARNWFGSGSRVIVTTRDKDVLRNRTDGEYKLESLNTKCALELFNLNAFETISPTDVKDIRFSKRVVEYAQGNPLALRVLGSFLHAKKRKYWEYELEKLKKLPIKDIQNVLRISYEGLDERQQRVFLDIVCFFNSTECRRYIVRKLGGGEWLEAEIDDLISRSLITEECETLTVHDLIKEMGREIVRQECVKEPGERSRLWDSEDCYRVLQNNTGTVTVEGISNFFYKQVAELELSPAMFNQMHSLRFLRMVGRESQNPQQLVCLPHSLQYLEWNCWPFKSLPTNYSPHNLVELNMRSSKLERLWSGDQKLGNLKHVHLSFSQALIDVSALSHAPNLNSVGLYSCGSLREIPSLKFGDLDESYHKCKNYECSTVGKLDLSRCHNLNYLPRISGCVKKLYISFTLIQELHSASSDYLSGLEELHLSKNIMLKIPTSVWKLESLKHLYLDSCNILGIPSDIRRLSLLEELDLSNNPIGQIPSGIQQLSKLRKLRILECKSLKFLPELPISLELLDVRGCTSLHNVPPSRDVIQREPWNDYHVTRNREFIFLRCPLDRYTRLNVVKGFILRALRTTAAIVLNDINVSEELFRPDINISFSGNKIPKWFLFQSEDSEIRTKLHPHWHNSNFLGFSIAFVMIKDPCVDLIIDFSCHLSFIKNDKKFRSFEWSFHNSLVYEDGGCNVMMWYKYENYRDFRDAEEVSVHFSSKYRGTLRVQACGFRPLYLRDYEDEFGKTVQFFNSKIVSLP